MSNRACNRRRFLGCSAAAGIALAQGQGLEVSTALAPSPVRLGFIGVGNRGTALLRAALTAPGARVTAVCDLETRHRERACGIVEKAIGARPAALVSIDDLLTRVDVDGVLIALPCDLHADAYVKALDAGKHVYAEKPLGLSVEDCDRVIAAAERSPRVVVRTGFQRRWNPRFQKGIERLRSGELGKVLGVRAVWLSGNGPMNGHAGWLGKRGRSGDWMLEQAVHVWDALCWLKGEPPVSAFGAGRRDVFPGRDVTDDYTAIVTWADGFNASLTHSWVTPGDDAQNGLVISLQAEDGLIDLPAGTVRYRDRTRGRGMLEGGKDSDTELAVREFVSAVRDPLNDTDSLSATLQDARLATQVGLLVRQAVDERRVVTWSEWFGPA